MGVGTIATANPEYGSPVIAFQVRTKESATIKKYRLNELSDEIAMPNKPYMCPVEALVDAIGGKWKIPILSLLYQETRRYGELRQRLPGVTERVLTMQLRELERSGLVLRTVYAEVPPKVEYSVTDMGISLKPVLQVMLNWSETYLCMIDQRADWWEELVRVEAASLE
jgi:DNA-binding HxlR family transcriptional regulator